MRIEPTDAAALRAVILRDLEAIERIEEHAASLMGSAALMSRAQVDSLGFALHNLYNALENSFTQISLSFENHVKDRVRWHRELLDKMFLTMPPFGRRFSRKPLVPCLLTCSLFAISSAMATICVSIRRRSLLYSPGGTGTDEGRSGTHSTPSAPGSQKPRACRPNSGDPIPRSDEMAGQTFRPNFFSSSEFEIWIMVGRPWGQQ